MERLTPEDLQKALPIPGVLCIVDELPGCDFCADGTEGPYDFRTKEGYWAHGCEYHWMANRASKDLGVGNGQYWMVRVTKP